MEIGRLNTVIWSVSFPPIMYMALGVVGSYSGSGFINGLIRGGGGSLLPPSPWSSLLFLLFLLPAELLCSVQNLTLEGLLEAGDPSVPAGCTLVFLLKRAEWLSMVTKSSKVARVKSKGVRRSISTPRPIPESGGVLSISANSLCRMLSRSNAPVVQ